jgi:predicted ABC-class ATPase
MRKAVANVDELRAALRRIEGRSYRAYRDVLRDGRFDFDDFALMVDHVQADPFAAPSKLRIRVPREIAEIPSDLSDTKVRRVALADFLARRVRSEIEAVQPSRSGSGKSGLIAIDAGGQEVLERSALCVTPEWIEARASVGLPASGRRALGHNAAELLCQILPLIARRALLWKELPQLELREFVDCVEDQEHLRGQLAERNLVAFVRNGALLPRESGASDRPMRSSTGVRFQSPASLELALELPVRDRKETKASDAKNTATTALGMGIPAGVTLIVGGGYHGKSTLLRALERGVHPHIPGDGREGVIAAPDLVKIRAEDGRYVAGVDIEGFIGSLPAGRNTEDFSSDDASGSTSQAANIIEALELGASGLLLDEDTSASNFMLRDARMQALVASSDEPITPFLDRVREIYDVHGVSTVLVMGGCGDYFEAADQVVLMRDYVAHDATQRAHEIARDHLSSRTSQARNPMRPITPRVPDPSSFDASRGRREVKIDARGVEQLRYGNYEIDLRCVEQLLDASQTRAIGLALHLAASRLMDRGDTLSDVLDALDRMLDERGLDILDPFGRRGEHPGALARPRRFEVGAAINRLRTLRVTQERP